jgi:hypothetical protein
VYRSLGVGRIRYQNFRSLAKAEVKIQWNGVPACTFWDNSRTTNAVNRNFSVDPCNGKPISLVRTSSWHLRTSSVVATCQMLNVQGCRGATMRIFSRRSLLDFSCLLGTEYSVQQVDQWETAGHHEPFDSCLSTWNSVCHWAVCAAHVQ